MHVFDFLLFIESCFYFENFNTDHDISVNFQCFYSTTQNLLDNVIFSYTLCNNHLSFVGMVKNPQIICKKIELFKVIKDKSFFNSFIAFYYEKKL